MRQFIKLIEVNALLLTIKKMGVNMKRIKALLGQTYYTMIMVLVLVMDDPLSESSFPFKMTI